MKKDQTRKSGPRSRLAGAYAAAAVVGAVLGLGAAPGNDTEAAKPSEEPPVGFEPSSEPDSDTALPPWRGLPEPDAAGGAGEVVVVVEIEDIIDMGVSAFVERAIGDHPDAAALILDINTPGGRVDAATKIRDAIMNAPKSMRTVAFINPRAISAGAFISFACDLIFIDEGGTIGAATPISIGGSGEAQPVEEKMVSYFRTEMAATARAKGRRGDIAEAMVDADVEIEGITPAGKLLTLDTAGALRYGVADAKASSLDDVLEKMALGGAEVKQLRTNWAEKLARILTHPILSGILMSIGVLGILMELYQPGFGVPGIIGVTCLVIFFAGHTVVNLAGWEEILLFVLGVALLIAEVFVTPGFGVLGALGVGSIVGALVLALSAYPLDVSFGTGEIAGAFLRVLTSLGIAIVLFVGLLTILPKTRLKHALILDAAVVGRSAGGREGLAVQEAVSRGDAGVAESYLRPSGIARFGGTRLDVITEGDFVPQGTKVTIVRVEGNHVIVRKSEEA